MGDRPDEEAPLLLQLGLPRDRFTQSPPHDLKGVTHLIDFTDAGRGNGKIEVARGNLVRGTADRLEWSHDVVTEQPAATEQRQEEPGEAGQDSCQKRLVRRCTGIEEIDRAGQFVAAIAQFNLPARAVRRSPPAPRSMLAGWNCPHVREQDPVRVIE